MTDEQGMRVHACPTDESNGLTPCCGRSLLEIPAWHRITVDGFVSCGQDIAPHPELDEAARLMAAEELRMANVRDRLVALGVDPRSLQVPSDSGTPVELPPELKQLMSLNPVNTLIDSLLDAAAERIRQQEAEALND